MIVACCKQRCYGLTTASPVSFKHCMILPISIPFFSWCSSSLFFGRTSSSALQRSSINLLGRSLDYKYDDARNSLIETPSLNTLRLQSEHKTALPISFKHCMKGMSWRIQSEHKRTQDCASSRIQPLESSLQGHALELDRLGRGLLLGFLFAWSRVKSEAS